MVTGFNNAWLLIERSAEGSQNPETGKWEESADPEKVYNAPVTWQDGGASLSAETIAKQMGVDVSEIHYRLFLSLPDLTDQILVGDSGVLTINDIDRQVQVLGKRLIDGSIFAKRMGEQ